MGSVAKALAVRFDVHPIQLPNVLTHCAPSCLCCCLLVAVPNLQQQVEKKTFAEEVNNAFKEAANGPMKGVLAVSEEPLVSVDFRYETRGRRWGDRQKDRVMMAGQLLLLLY